MIHYPIDSFFNREPARGAHVVRVARSIGTVDTLARTRRAPSHKGGGFLAPSRPRVVALQRGAAPHPAGRLGPAALSPPGRGMRWSRFGVSANLAATPGKTF